MDLPYTSKNPPASTEAITLAMQQCTIEPRAWICGFWAQCDGAMIIDLVQIYSTDMITERQQTYEIAAYFPDHLLVGDDSGGRLILLERSGKHRFYLQDSGDPFIDDAMAFSSIDDLIKAVASEP
ncbi:hypothetical protein [Pseudomonas sp. KNUC1026]|uniref:hypothetical protein n=1 Tax=Pseudomonas sp. KNUC1026 TaxID=2893890 RepID=UPI001F265493|nr:hypothetical protein [Pseudomonas sp. KNUC1026]UFH51288.1 hypothetical protein LN139_09850 [Pseudomonas sp. KNUC1026]